ncbi:hypothetical protein D3C73_670940 [compost metagenome]
MLKQFASQNQPSISNASGAAAYSRYSRGYAATGQGQLRGLAINTRYRLGRIAQPSQRQALYCSESSNRPKRNCSASTPINNQHPSTWAALKARADSIGANRRNEIKCTKNTAVQASQPKLAAG